MPNLLNENGLQIATQAELSTYFTTNYQAIYGSNINLSSSTQDGQFLNIVLQSILDNAELFLSIFNSFDPDNAIGKILDQRVALNGIQRQAGTFSTTDVTITLSQSVNLYGQDQTLQPIFTVSDNGGVQWQLITTQLGVGPGVVTGSFRAVNPGAVFTNPNTIRVPVTIILGVILINNPNTQTSVGINEETDAELRIRRQQSVSASSQGYLAGLLGTLLNINGVNSAFVYENTTSSTDANGVPGHSIWVIVSGNPAPALQAAWSSIVTYAYGQVVSLGGVNYISWQNNNLNNTPPNAAFWGIYNPIAQSIYDKRNAGAGMKGNTSYTVTQVDGTPFVVKWDVVTFQNLFIAFAAQSINGITPPNYAALLDPNTGLATILKPGVNEEVNINELGTLAQQIDPNTLAVAYSPLGGFTLALKQTLQLTDIPTAGSFVALYNGVSSAPILFSDSAGQIQTKLNAMAGLANATVTGSLASLVVTIFLNETSALGLITVPDATNSLLNGSAQPIVFLYNEYYQNILTPTAKNNQFQISVPNIIILPLIAAPATLTIPNGQSQVFTVYGGYGTLLFSFYSSDSTPPPLVVSGNKVTYTAGSLTGNDVIQAQDALGNFVLISIIVT